MIPISGNSSRVHRVLLAWALVPATIGFVAVLFGFSWSAFEVCENSRLRDVTAPQGLWRLVVYEQKCSGTVEWTTHISVVRELDMLPKARGNILVSFGRHGSLIGNSVDEPEVVARWQAPDVIEVKYSTTAPPPPPQFAASEVGDFRIVHTRHEEGVAQ